MLSAEAKILETMIHTVVSQKFPDRPPTEDKFMSVAVDCRSRLFPVSDAEFQQIIRNLKSRMLITMDKGVYIWTPDNEHQSWLPSRRAEVDWFFWNRYRQYLESEKKWNPRVIANLDTMSSEILDLLGDPKSGKPWQRRGLVIGDVQSGKTSFYTAVCNKAADTGYKVIIVLAGLTDVLRIQTQERLDKEFSGRKSKYLLQKSREHEILDERDGVGLIDYRKRVAAFTTVRYDFNSTLLNSNDLSLKGLRDPALFVVKKNKSILSSLERWLKSNNAVNGKIDLPLLLIDDEADNASINTRRHDEEETAINRKIRSILSLFTQASYLGTTATPFANIFIDPDKYDDLFPRDFIYLLYPPTNYIGPKSIFGEEAPYSNCIVRVDKDEMEAFIPLGHKRDWPVEDLPPSLEEALGYFLLVNAVRDVRGDITEHRSMLVNVSRFTDVQMRIKARIDEWLSQVRSDIENYAGLPPKQSLQIKSLLFLKQVWDKYDLTKISQTTWAEVQKEHLRRAVGPIVVKAVNQRTGATSLDYYAHKEGLRVIAVGGNSLSRGLTLEGLVVSYFYRGTKMYDTLLQMGRWFGYRPNYADLCKIWTTDEIEGWYEFITTATDELKREIERMKQANLTPMEFGLKVRRHPDTLIVTALNKMRTATVMTVPVEVSVYGKLVETPRLKLSPGVLEANERAFRQFIAQMSTIASPTKTNKGFLWSGIPKQLVVDLLYSFDTHPWHLSFQGEALAAFFEKAPDLDLWDVVLPAGTHGKGDLVNLGTEDHPLTVRKEKRLVDTVDQYNMIRISGSKLRVGSGGLTQAGLTGTQISNVEARFRRSNHGKHVPDTEYLIEGRNPLLMLHVIQPNCKVKNVPDTLYALGLGTPRKDLPAEKEDTATYLINLVEFRNLLGMDYSEDDTDDE